MRITVPRLIGLGAMILALLAPMASSGAGADGSAMREALRLSARELLANLGRDGEEDAALRLHGEIRRLWADARRDGQPPRLEPAFGDSLYGVLFDAWDRARTPAARSALARSLPTLAPTRVADDYTALFLAPAWRGRVDGAIKPLIYAIARAENPVPRLLRIAEHTRDAEVMRAVAIARQAEAGYTELCALFDLSARLADDAAKPLPAPRVEVCWPALAESLAADADCRMAPHFQRLAARLGPFPALDYLLAHPKPACPSLRAAFIDVILRDAPAHADLSRPGESLEERADALRALGLTRAQADALQSRLEAVSLLE